MYSPQLLEHFEHPRNPGVVESPEAVAQLENPVCGDVLSLSARITDGRITEIRFKAKGCVPAMACGSVVTELVKGKTLAEATEVRRVNVIQALSELPQASSHAVQLAVETLALLLRNAKHEGKKGSSSTQLRALRVEPH